MIDNKEKQQSLNSSPARSRKLQDIPSFDELVALSNADPKGFEKLRTELCEQAIADAPESMQPRLKGLQFQIDMERKRSSSPLDTCVRLSRMMNESLLALNSALTNPGEYMRRRYGTKADVLPMQPRKA